MTLRDLYQEIESGLPNGTIKTQATQLVQSLEAVFKADDPVETLNLCRTLTTLHMSVPKLSFLSRALHAAAHGGFARDQDALTSDAPYVLTPHVRSLICQHLDLRSLARTKAVDKAFKCDLDAVMVDRVQSSSEVTRQLRDEIESKLRAKSVAWLADPTDEHMDDVCAVQAGILLSLPRTGLPPEDILALAMADHIRLHNMHILDSLALLKMLYRCVPSPGPAWPLLHLHRTAKMRLLLSLMHLTNQTIQTWGPSHGAQHSFCAASSRLFAAIADGLTPEDIDGYHDMPLDVNAAVCLWSRYREGVYVTGASDFARYFWLMFEHLWSAVHDRGGAQQQHRVKAHLLAQKDRHRWPDMPPWF